tara:strand:- start:258 stop:512 length:255 start_codon:yes stop_codon:yes gene_type:complete
MSTISALAHHIDQLLTQHRALQLEHTHLQSRVMELEQQVQQQQAASNLAQDIHLESDRAHKQTIENELNGLISLFDQSMETKHD